MIPFLIGLTLGSLGGFLAAALLSARREAHIRDSLKSATLLAPPPAKRHPVFQAPLILNNSPHDYSR